MIPFANASPRRKALLIATMGILIIGVLIVIAMAIALALLHQLGPHTDIFAAPAWFRRYRAHRSVAHALLIGALMAISLGAALLVSVLIRLKPPLHGAARFAGEDEIKLARLREPSGILIGLKGGKPLIFGGDEHAILHAPTRSGKGVGVVIPNLLSWSGSVVVLDVKKELFDITAGYREAIGQEVFLFDPLDPLGRTARYNPLGFIDRRDPISVLDELQKIAGMLFPLPTNAEAFWAESARIGFIGVGAMIAETPTLPFTLGQIYRELTAGEPRKRFPEEIKRRAAAGRPLSRGCVNALTDFCSAPDNTFGGIKQSITSRMGLWLNPRVDAATSASDFDFREISTQRVSIYFGASVDNMVRVAPLYNLVFQQLVDLNVREKPLQGPAVSPALILLDEFARLGASETLARGFSYIGGYGFRILAVIQTPAQLREIYGPELAKEIFIGAAVEMVFTPGDMADAEALSTRIGAISYPARSKSWPALFSNGHASTSESAQRRALMLPQELLWMSHRKMLVFRRGTPPVQARKIRYFREKAFKARLLKPPIVPRLVDAASSFSPGPQSASPLTPLYVVRKAERKMTVEEAAGEALLALDAVSASFAAVGMDVLPPGAHEEEYYGFAQRYVSLAAKDREECRGATGGPLPSPAPMKVSELRHG